MTTVLLVLPVALTAAYLLVRTVNRRGWAATWDLICGEPDSLTFDKPLPDTSIDYAKRQEHQP